MTQANGSKTVTAIKDVFKVEDGQITQHNFKSYEDTISAMGDAVVDISTITGDVPPVDKETLQGVEFVVLNWKEHPGVGEAPFVYVQVMTKAGQLTAFVDGGQGIRDALKEFSAATEGRMYGLRAPKGLRASKYDLPERGLKDCQTWYFA